MFQKIMMKNYFQAIMSEDGKKSNHSSASALSERDRSRESRNTLYLLLSVLSLSL